MVVNSELLQRVWFLLLERETLGDGFTVTVQDAFVVPQSPVLVMVMEPPSLGMPLISFVSSL